MAVPQVVFPVPYEQIPATVKELVSFIQGRQSEIDVARSMLLHVRAGCKHEGAQRGYNDRDGDWMNPCPHCGATK